MFLFFPYMKQSQKNNKNSKLQNSQKPALLHSALPAFATTFRGFEQAALQEIQELLGVSATLGTGFLTFCATDLQLAELCYKSQALRSVLRVFGQCSFAETLDSLEREAAQLLKHADLSILTGHTFRVECERSGDHAFTSRDVAALVGKQICALYPALVVDLKNPEITVFCYVQNDICFLGIDFAGCDLTKREYKIYTQANTLNAGFAYCFVRFAGYTGKEILVDPHCGVGLFPIEAALFATKTSPRFYQKDIFAFHKFLSVDLSLFDKNVPIKQAKKISLTGYDVHLRNMEAAKKHAKLCNVQKFVSFARADMEWMDTKVDEKGADIIVCQTPVEGRAFPEKDLEKFYKEFYYQLEFILKDNGKMVLLCQKTGILKKMLDYFVIIDEHLVYQGEQEFTIVTMKKKSQ